MNNSSIKPKLRIPASGAQYSRHNSSVKRDTLLDFFADFAELPDPFLVYDDGFRVEQRTYRQTAQAARALAVRLHEAGVRKGDKIVIWSENRPEWIAAFWACLLTGAIVVPVDYRASSGFLLRIRDKVEARIVWIGDEVVWPEGSRAPPVAARRSRLDRRAHGSRRARHAAMTSPKSSSLPEPRPIPRA